MESMNGPEHEQWTVDTVHRLRFLSEPVQYISRLETLQEKKERKLGGTF
jgi:hypothetical protein